MKIYLVSTNDNVSYDEYDSVVVIAESTADAVIIAKKNCYNFRDNLSILEIGIAHNDQQRGAVLASFNAG
jgi:hypothetical protein